MITYERDPKSIYAASFATVRNEANLARFSPEMQAVVIQHLTILLEILKIFGQSICKQI
ncbi:hypothetical protein N8Z41_03845 [Amylibacter sp.]|nr:hypothetical protein [Amylibacter sp.]